MTVEAAAVIEGLLDAAWLVHPQTLRVQAANAAAGRLVGVASTDLHRWAVTELAATPEDLAFWDEVACGGCEELHSDTLVRRVDGSTVPVSRRASRVGVQGGGALWLVVLRDRSEQRRVEDELEARVAELNATLESTADGILATDLEGAIRGYNRRFAALWALPPELQARRDDVAVGAWMRACVVDAADYARRLDALQQGAPESSRDVIELRSGRVLERVSLPQRSRGRPIGRVYSFRDLTETLAARQRIEQLSHTDALTGLPNRHLLADRLGQALALARRQGLPFAVLVLDLDRFKHINDTLGRDVGDRVLLEVAERIKLCLREVDTVARLGGDQFALLLHQADAGGAEATARRVLEAMARPWAFDGLSFTLTGSLGIAMYPLDGASLDELHKHAEAAMRRAKEGGRAGYRFHQPRPDPGLRSRLKLDHAMRLALAQERFSLHYQPQIDLASGEVRGAEALLRWHDPLLGQVPPAEFIPVAEDSGFIVALGDWVLERALRQASDWHARGLRLGVSVNVSALQFRQAGFVDRVAAALQAGAVPPGLIELELTESILIRDADEALQRLQALSRLGLRLAIDDFGTGYSSLGYLKRFPIERLKIDRSFVQGLPRDESDAGIARAIIHLGRALRLQVIAEGVETEAQHRFLREAGCDQFQGFLYAPALPSTEFEARLRAAQPPVRLVGV